MLETSNVQPNKTFLNIFISILFVCTHLIKLELLLLESIIYVNRINLLIQVNGQGFYQLKKISSYSLIGVVESVYSFSMDRVFMYL